ncbi:HD-GYP domain-containing protein [Mucisphaera calidilacus]|uniref:Cyclic di-GMP phosphodiesterase response regulator RpfG n=1 Tax=Mucisphaera calidilacus TaxID=2527982 RepID=A0A518BTA5_9BACT|nr:HD domain-containing phosphohydrolase [Mucisphaera calidilacus]QDU70204.1 Cyclic di-GMP phosphodiesterase response regulator RpfG [Mucisphaera calidilacus]
MSTPAPNDRQPYVATTRERLRRLGIPVVDLAIDGHTVTHAIDCPVSSTTLDHLLAASVIRELTETPLRFCPITDTLYAINISPEQPTDTLAVALISHGDHASTRSEAHRIEQLLRWWSEDTQQLEVARHTAQQNGHELALAYEELSLIDHLTQHSELRESTENRLDEAVQDLREVARLRFLALHLADDRPRLNVLRGKTFFPEDSVTSIRSIRAAGDWLLARLGNTPGVTRFAPELHEGLSALGTEILAMKIRHRDQVLGVLYGADRFDGQPFDATDMARFESLGTSISVFLNNALLFTEMHGLFVGTLSALSTAIDAKDAYTHGHSQRVASLTRQLARAAGFGVVDTERLYRSALVHDLGKIGVPEAILTKEGKLTREEFDAIKRHPQIGARILRDIESMTELIPGVLSHHERWSGGGYPQGIAGRAIPFEGRVIALADSYDAMRSKRSYRDAMPHEQAMEEVRRGRGTQFEPELADAFLTLDFDAYNDPQQDSTRRAA